VLGKTASEPGGWACAPAVEPLVIIDTMAEVIAGRSHSEFRGLFLGLVQLLQPTFA
jgi:hypothetical protein